MPTAPALPADTGTYLLGLHLPSPTRITVGALGEVAFPAGDYLYVGSAFGRGGLRARLKHHLRPLARCHWHVDYLRQSASVTDLWYATSSEKQECSWATTLLAQPQMQPVMDGFGATDCTCPTHLLVSADSRLENLPHLLSSSLTHRAIPSDA